MIEKLEPLQGLDHSWLNKINELVDAVNGILDYAPLEMAQKVEPADPYAEQRKWIGKICRFWNDDESLEDSMYGELVNIFDTPHVDCPFQCQYGEWYEHCEPVKPDDSIIYKG